VWLLAFGLALGAGTVLFLQTRSFGLLGFDSYPILATSRIDSFAGILDIFAETLMGDYYPTAFYRPLTSLTFALDQALGGMNPLGYQLTGVLLYVGAAMAIFVLAGRLNGAGAAIAPWVALLVFLLHPVQYDVVPIPPRRADLLCCAFMMLSLYLQLAPRALRTRFPLWPALAMLAAIASKETAFVLPAVSFVAVFLYAPYAGWRERSGRAAMALVPHAIVAAALLALRGSLGFVGFEALAVGAGGILPATPAGRWLFVGVAVAVLVGLALGLLAAAWREPGAGGTPSRTSVRAELVPFVLVVAVLALTHGRENPWRLDYQYLIPVAGWALLCGAVSDRLIRFARPLGVVSALASGAMIVLLALPVVWQARYSPLIYHYGEGERATEAAGAFLDASRALLDEATEGGVVVAPPFPRRVPPVDPLRTFGTMIFSDYSVQAWADLTFPGRRVRVVHGPTATPESLAAAPDEVVLVLETEREGF
jgi:hypothetical protein